MRTDGWRPQVLTHRPERCQSCDRLILRGTRVLRAHGRFVHDLEKCREARPWAS